MRPSAPIAGFHHRREDGTIFVHARDLPPEAGGLLKVGESIAFSLKHPRDETKDWEACKVRMLGEVGDRSAPAPPTKRKAKRGGGPTTVAEEGDANEATRPDANEAPKPLDIKSRMNAHTIPDFGMILPHASTAPAGNMCIPTRIEGLLWEARGSASDRGAPKRNADWYCHPFDPSLLPLAKVAGIKPGDTPENLTVTMHFVLCPEVSGVALHQATVGPANRDSRYSKFMGDELSAADLGRYGLIQPVALPPLQSPAVAAESREAAAEKSEGDGEDEDKAKKE